ncbi:MAG: DUF2591 domain-containing protein [Burkholderiaceae bacterium]|nr:DUF2591 domain-containing protein [Burkholderiaceae bacterium]
MTIISTSELSGPALDWAVAQTAEKCEGISFKVIDGMPVGVDKDDDRTICIFFNLPRGNFKDRLHQRSRLGTAGEHAVLYEPSQNWAQAGPIIYREQIGISPPGSRVHRNGGNSPGWGPSGIWTATTWHAGVNGRRAIAWHETDPLVAAMRCYVASKLGDSVDVPDELAPANEKGQTP